MFCIPTALEIMTGEDPESVIFPAINRRRRRDNLLDPVAGEPMAVAADVLEELGYHVRKYKGKRLHALVRDWAQRFPNHVIFVAAGGKGEEHCLVLHEGKAYDSWEPFGKDAAAHPYHNTQVRWAALIQRKES